MKEQLNTKLRSFAERGDLIGVSDMINKGADINAISSLGYTALQLACMKLWNNEITAKHIIDSLLSSGANLNQVTEHGTALHCAIQAKNETIAHYLICDKNAHTELKNSEGLTPIQLTIKLIKETENLSKEQEDKNDNN